jgi:hypothetical protein
MLPLLLAVAAGGLIAKQMTDYPSEIRNLRKQMPKEEREDFIRDYKQLPNDTKTQFKQYLREANLVEAGKLIGKDLTSYNVKAKEKKEEQSAAPAADSVATDNGFNLRIQNILNSYQLDSEPQLVADAAKQYEKIAGYNEMNIVDKTRKLLDVSQ